MKTISSDKMVIGKKYVIAKIGDNNFAFDTKDIPFTYLGTVNAGMYDMHILEFEHKALDTIKQYYRTDRPSFEVTEVKAKRKPRMTPQCALILQHLRKGHTITQRSALIDFGIAALPRRIADLKEQGYPVESVIEHNKLTGQRYARYSLAA